MTAGAAALAIDETVEMVNLPRRRTGADGTIFIPTAMAAHGPRITWFPGKAGRDEPCLVITLEDPPRAINMGLPRRVARDGEAAAVAWATLNRAALLDFWANGTALDVDEVVAFTDGLAKFRDGGNTGHRSGLKVVHKT